MQVLSSCLCIIQSVTHKSGCQLSFILAHMSLCVCPKFLLKRLGAIEHVMYLLQVRRSPQHAPAVSPTSQNMSNESLTAQAAANKAAAELIAEEQLAAIQQQQACIKTICDKAKKQKQKLAQKSQPGRTDSNRSAKGGQSPKSGHLASNYPINIDAVVSLLMQPLPHNSLLHLAHD